MKYLLTESVRHLKLPSIKVERKTFPDGELYIRIKEDVKDKPLTIISNLTPTNFLELLFCVDAAKRAGAILKRLIIPYLSYARQDKLYCPGEAVSGEVVCSVLNLLNLPVVVFDIHNPAILKSSHLRNVSLLPHLVKSLPKANYLVASPDAGGKSRAAEIAKILKAPLIVMKKSKSSGKIKVKLMDKVKGKDILLVDDMISTGGTIIQATKVLKLNGAKTVFCIITHGLLVGKAKQQLKKSGINRVIVSNTLPVKEALSITVVSIGSSIKKLNLNK